MVLPVRCPEPDEASMRPRELPAEDRHINQTFSARTMASMRPRELPAEDGSVVSPVRDAARCFNEAAGVTRGRRPPRPRAAATTPRFNEAAGVTRGRPINLDDCRLPVGASMRPRELPAEDLQRGDSPADRFNGASMRPRELPAEDTMRVPALRTSAPGFNEAAGVTRGRPDLRCATRLGGDASMRPRELPAEDVTR